MPNALPWFPFYVDDYLHDTYDLSPCEHGVYLLLLSRFWVSGPLRDNLDALCRVAAGASPQMVREILERFWELTDLGWVNRRMEREALRSESRRADRTEAARISWEKRRGKSTDDGMQMHEQNGCIEHGETGGNLPKTENPIKSTAGGMQMHEQMHKQPQCYPQSQSYPSSAPPDKAENPQPPPVGGQKTKTNRGTRIQAQTLPDDWRDWTRQHFPTLRPDRTFDSFRDYWLAAPGQKGVKADWLATWRNWCRTEAQRSGVAGTEPVQAQPRRKLADILAQQS